MASKLEKSEKNLRKIQVDVSQDDFKKAMNEAFKKNQKRFQVPGFRKGKAPMPIVTNYYGEAVLYDDAIDIAMQPAYEAALKEHEIEPFSHPEVQIDQVGMEKGLSFTVTVAVRPEVKLADVKKLEAYRPSDKVEEEEIEKRIERDRLRVSRLVPVEREVKDGDTVTMDYEGSIDGVPFEGGKAEKYELKIGSGSFIPGFEAALIGHKKAEDFTIDVTFPEDYHSRELAGKAAVFQVKLHEVREREMPELDDDFVKDISEELNTVDEYRASVRAELEKAAKERADSEFKQRASEAYVKGAEIDLPGLAIEDETDEMLNEQRRQMAYQGFKLEDYLKYLNISEQVFRMQLRASAEQRLRERLVLDALAKGQKLEVSDEDTDKRLHDFATVYGRSYEDIKKEFPEESLAALKETMLREKAVEYLASKAKVLDKLPEEEKPGEQPPEA